MKPSDWIDVALHIAGAAVVVAVVGWGGVWGAAAVNAALWPLREAEQRRLRGKRPFAGWSRQNHWEAWPPGLIGGIVAWMW